jgi:hypothetical protein
MRSYLMKVGVYVILMMSVLCLSLLFIPYRTLEPYGLLLTLLDKHRLLHDANEPRLIFVGGSNLGFGLDSAQISREYLIDVINMGIHGGLGLRYMLNDVRPFIRKGDVVVVVPEYHQFALNKSHVSYGSQELLCVLFDIYPGGREHIGPRQWIHLSRFVPTYAAGKIVMAIKYAVRTILRRAREANVGAYDRRALNSHGDMVAHWAMGSSKVLSVSITDEVDMDAVSFLVGFMRFVQSKQARSYFLCPCFNATSFRRSASFIVKLQRVLDGHGDVSVLSTPERYMLSDESFFDTAYHLNKNGVDLRTKRVIEDLRSIFKK